MTGEDEETAARPVPLEGAGPVTTEAERLLVEAARSFALAAVALEDARFSPKANDDYDAAKKELLDAARALVDSNA